MVLNTVSQVPEMPQLFFDAGSTGLRDVYEYTFVLLVYHLFGLGVAAKSFSRGCKCQSRTVWNFCINGRLSGMRGDSCR